MMSALVSSLFTAVLLLHLPQESASIVCSENAIRLSDGRNEQEGRLEICNDGVWSTICNNLWTLENTKVVCRQLGIGELGYYLNTIPFGSGFGITRPFQCTGEESELSNCTVVEQGPRCTTHAEDVRLACIPSGTPPECEDGSLRLVDRISDHDGRLEICQVGKWGTICNDMWDRNDAIVACRHLGINATTAYVETHFRGTGPIFLSGLGCLGTEENITDCPTDLTALHDNDCTHINDSGLYCSIQTEPECIDEDLRLADGRTRYEGRVEVCQEGVWGSVCATNWPSNLMTNNALVCRQAGINATVALTGTFGRVSGPIHLFDVQCTGTEESLFNCRHSNINYCYSSDPVGVICTTENDTVAECEEPSVRLVDHSGVPTEGSGLVEMCMGGRWSRVCNNFWDRTEATVVCNELNYPSSAAVGYLVDDGDYIGPVVSASCSLSRPSIYSCFTNYFCLEQKHGFVICTGNNGSSTCEDGDLRIGDPVEEMVGSELTVGGRLEMCYQGEWGTVCDDEWTISDAIVACRQLGHKTEGARFVFLYEPPGIGPLILDNLHCSGAEESLLVCPHNPLNQHNCIVLENVGLYCDKFAVSATNAMTTSSTEAEVEVTTAIPASSFGSTQIILVCALVLLLAVIVVVVAALIFRRRKKAPVTLSSLRERLELSTANPIYNRQNIPRPNEYNLDMSVSTAANMRVYHAPAPPTVRGSFVRKITEDFIIPLKSLTLLTKIGEGEFGVVYKAKFSSAGKMNQLVAVKTLKGTYSQEEVDAMLEEGLKLKHFQHPNVLSLIGVCVEAGPAPYIVMPYMSNGSLLSYLRQEKLALVLPDNVDEEIVADVTKRLTTMCQQISKGMKYLAGEKFIHRDLAARNCMIDEHFMIKIADFGLSEDIYCKTYFRQQSNVSVKLPVKWMALESLQEGVFSEKTDVWAFGVTCWEVFSGGKYPYPGIGPMDMVQLLERGERLMHPNNAACTKKMYALMMSCWMQQPHKRPTFSELSEVLDKYLEELAGYMNMGCLFPEIQHQQDPNKAVQRSSPVISGRQGYAPMAPATSGTMSINLISPGGSTSFL